LFHAASALGVFALQGFPLHRNLSGFVTHRFPSRRFPLARRACAASPGGSFRQSPFTAAGVLHPTTGRYPLGCFVAFTVSSFRLAARRGQPLD
jgi:hypothetical protein